MDIDDLTMTPQPDGTVQVEMTVGEETMARIRQLRHLYRDEVPNGDLGKILALALDALLEEIRHQASAGHPGH
jgi:hypothetical protein